MDDGLSFGLMALLGAYHGLNPAMGWLFAVGLGLQERSRGAVLRALAPIAIGHELALALVAGVVVVLGLLADPRPLHIGAGVVLIAFGLFRFARPRAHPRWTKGRVTPRELALWSFLMASAHGAGLMVAPLLLGGGGGDVASHALDDLGRGALGLLLHVAVMLAVMAAVAVLVYDRLGLRVLRTAWFNTDALWAGAFVLAGAITLFS
jgi:hypothetical protein